METTLGIVIGLGLAAATGFRVFLPFLVLSLAARAGAVPLSHGFDWVATTPALLAFATATLLEILAYSIPWVDHMLDALATPLALGAGIVASAAVMTDLPPLVKWGLAILAGGGAAGFVQGATVLARLKSSLFTGGIANPVVAALELAGALITSILAVLVPLLSLALVVVVCIAIFRASRRLAFGRWRRHARPAG